MKISTKGRYALRVMLDLALNSDGRCIPLKEIAARQSISEKYLEQIFTALGRAGLLRSTRGAQGGYTLAFSPEEITAGMILRATEGDLAPVECVSAAGGECPRSVNCVTAEVWEKIRAAVDDVVNHITLADLVSRYYEKQV